MRFSLTFFMKFLLKQGQFYPYYTTVEPPLTATSQQQQLFLADSPYIDSRLNLSLLFKPLSSVPI